jgi:hypothetical protein
MSRLYTNTETETQNLLVMCFKLSSTFLIPPSAFLSNDPVGYEHTYILCQGYVTLQGVKIHCPAPVGLNTVTSLYVTHL